MEQLTKEQIAQLKHLAKLEACRKHYQTYVEYVHRGLWFAGKHLRYICKDVESLLNGTLYNDVGNEVKILLLSLPPQHGKLLADTTPVPTPEGVTLHGYLSIGDYVYNRYGKPTRVTAISNEGHIADHIVKFGDGTEIKCHLQHEWVVYDAKFKIERTLETQEMLQTKLKLGRVCRYQVDPKLMGIGHLATPVHMATRRGITSITPCTPERGKCITVEGGVYLVGHNYIPTHNSQCITETLPSWYLGNNPDKRVIIASYNTEFSSRFGRRNISKIQEFGKEIFNLTLSKETSDNFEVSGNVGACICRGIMSGITGNPADLIILDDTIKNREEADSETYRSKLWDEYLNSVKTRLSSSGKIIVIQTRWHESDLIGQILENEGHKCKYINFPCEAEENDVLGRKIGDSLFPEIGKDNDWLKDFKLSYMTQEGSRAWQALFQGHPSALQGNLLKREWWRYYDTLPTQLDRICQSWDCTFKDSATSDYVVGQVWGMQGLDCYLIDQVRARMDFPTTLAAIEAMKAKYPQTQRIFIEDKANGSAIISVLASKITGIIPVLPEGGKIARVNAISAHIESGHVYLPKFASFLNDFLNECSMFPNGSNDDCVDALSQSINRMMYYRNIDKPVIQYRQGGHYLKKELLAKGFKEAEILRMARQGKIKLLGK